MPGADWFPGARLSYAEHVFRGRDDDDVAIRHASELRPLGEWTWGELRAHAGAVAAALREAGVVAGDRVAAYLPNIPETIAAFLGCASIGAIWSSCAPEFGVRSVVDRFAQIEPKVLLDGRRLPLRRQGLRPERDDRGARARAADARVGRSSSRTWPAATGSCPPPSSSSPSCRSTTRSGCSTAPARPACRRRSSTARAGSCSSTSRSSACTSTRGPATASSGSRRPAG